jgi:hypothetical protein
MKIKEINSKKVSDNYGYYSFWLKMENQAESYLLRQKNIDCQFKVGDEIPEDWTKAEASYTDKNGNAVKYFKLSAPKKDNPFTAKQKVKPNNASFALSYAKDLHVAGKVTFDEMLTVAAKFLQWLNEN